MAISNPIEQIKERLDVVEVISARVGLKKSGRTFKGLCPFHAEKTPSFVVFPEKGNYHCFGCGANGDIFTFTMKTENLDFAGALRVLAERAGVTLKPRQARALEDQHRARLHEINLAAAQFYHNLLRRDAGREALGYLRRRGITEETDETYQLGWAPDGYDVLTQYLLSRNWAITDLLEAGVAAQREGSGVRDYLRARITFPIRDEHGNVTGFGARTLGDAQPKYLNTAQTPIFDKGGSLYGLDRAPDAIRETGMVVVVEGYMDVLIAHQSGIKNVVASLGTALTERQVAILKRLTRHLVLALDPDVAGQAAAMRGVDVARQVYGEAVPVPLSTGLVRLEQRLDADLRIAGLPAGQDPDEIIRANPEKWRELIAGAKPVIDQYFDVVLAGADLTTSAGQTEAARRLLPIIGELRDQLQQHHYLQRLSQLVRIPEQLLVSELSRLRLQQKGRRSPETGLTEEVVERLHVRPGAVLDEYFIEVMLRYHEKTGTLLDELRPEDMGSTEAREVLRALNDQVAREGTPDPVALVDQLEETLANWLAERIEGAHGTSLLYEGQLHRELGNCVREIRRRNLRWQVEQLSEAMRRSAEDGEETEGESEEFRARVEELLTEIQAQETDGTRAGVWRSVQSGDRGRAEKEHPQGK